MNHAAPCSVPHYSVIGRRQDDAFPFPILLKKKGIVDGRHSLPEASRRRGVIATQALFGIYINFATVTDIAEGVMVSFRNVLLHLWLHAAERSCRSDAVAAPRRRCDRPYLSLCP